MLWRRKEGVAQAGRNDLQSKQHTSVAPVAPPPRGAPAGGIGLPTAVSQSSHCTPLDQGDWATCVANAMVRVMQDVMMLKYNTCIDEKGLRTYTVVAAGAYHLVFIRH